MNPMLLLGNSLSVTGDWKGTEFNETLTKTETRGSNSTYYC